MKNFNLLILISFSLLLTACLPELPGQESNLKFTEKPSIKDVDLTNPNLSKFGKFNALLKANCVTCHNDVSARKGISLEFETEADLLASGYVEAGKPSASDLYRSLRGSNGLSRMPPSGPLTNDEIAFVEDYIKSLAPGTLDTVVAAELDESTTSYDPEKIRLTFTCNESTPLDIEVYQDLGAGPVSVGTTTVTCVQDQAKEKVVALGTLPGLSANAVQVVVRKGGVEITRTNLQKLPSVATLPNAVQNCFGEANYIPKFKLKKLSRRQAENILRDLFLDFGVDASTEIAPLANFLIEDTISKDLISTEFFSKNDLSFSKQNAEGISVLYTQLIATLEMNPGFKTTVEAACTGLSKSSCFELIIDHHVFRLMKGQVPTDLRSQLIIAAQDFDNKYDGIVALLEAAIVSPYFAFELYATDVTPQFIELTEEELFYKSYLALFDTLPSWQHVSEWYLSGLSYSDFVSAKIGSDANLRSKFKKTVGVFFKEWFHLKPEETIQSTDFANLIQDRIPAGLRTDFKKNSQDGLIESLSSRVSTDALELRDIFFWDSSVVTGLPFESLVEYDGSGEVTLAALPPMLFSGLNYNNIFARGASVYKRLMCGDFRGIDPPGALSLEGVSAAETTRGHFEAMTPKSSSCFGCHQRFNGIGYNLEEYGVLGERRSDGFEKRYDSSGNVTESLPLSLGGEINYLNNFYYTPSISTLMEKLDQKGILKRCATKQMGQYFLRLDDSPENSCTLEKISRTTNTSVKDIILSIIASESFQRQRR